MISTQDIPDGAIDGRQAVAQPSTARVVPKPVPESQSQDPRKYQIEQLKKRFSPKQSNLQNGTTNLVFQLRPSDPDFPYELDYLDCELQVPRSYPEGSPVLRVRNKDIPRGFSLNIEKGWDKLIHEKQATTLLALINALDRNLEAFLSEQKTETVTLVSFKDTRHLESSATELGSITSSASNTAPEPTAAPRKPYIPDESFTREQIADAKAKRAQEVRQLEARMGRLSLFHKSADGIVYTLPLEPKRRMELPIELQVVQSVQLIIPLLYPLQPLKILLNDVESHDAEHLEETFAEKAAGQKQMSLMSHLNYLAQNMHVLAKVPQVPAKEAPASEAKGDTAVEDAKQGATGTIVDRDIKSHIQVIPRPPEWTFIEEDEDTEDESDDMSWDSGDQSDEGGAAVTSTTAQPSQGAHQAESGTSISFPLVELHGIELLQVAILSINVKCERCRAINEMTRLKPNAEKTGSCKKCATPFVAKFRQEYVHQHNIRAGFIDVTGCTVSDMLPRYFLPSFHLPTPNEY